MWRKIEKIGIRRLQSGIGIEEVGIGLNSHGFISSRNSTMWFKYMTNDSHYATM